MKHSEREKERKGKRNQDTISILLRRSSSRVFSSRSSLEASTNASEPLLETLGVRETGLPLAGGVTPKLLRSEAC